MKLLRFVFDHLRMFEDGRFAFDFLTEDRVPAADETVHLLKKSIYTNNVMALAGINASGKTMSLSLIDFALRIVSGRSLNDSIDASYYADLFEETATFSALVQYSHQLFIIETELMVNSAAPSYVSSQKRFTIKEERLFMLSSNLSKRALMLDFDDLKEKALDVDARSGFIDNIKKALGDDRSASLIFVDEFPLIVRLDAHDKGFSFPEDMSDADEILRVFDASIRSIERDEDAKTIELSIEGRPDPLTLTASDVERVLSSGTMKGFKLATIILEVLKGSNYLLVDEIENHLNKLLVQMIIGLFSDKETNPHGATLVFTTHYPEILDCIHRKDNVYFLVRTDRGKISEVKYSDRVSRIENKKSEVFVSNYIKGTAPKFADVDAFKKLVKRTAHASAGRSES